MFIKLTYITAATASGFILEHFYFEKVKMFRWRASGSRRRREFAKNRAFGRTLHTISCSAFRAKYQISKLNGFRLNPLWRGRGALILKRMMFLYKKA